MTNSTETNRLLAIVCFTVVAFASFSFLYARNFAIAPPRDDQGDPVTGPGASDLPDNATHRGLRSLEFGPDSEIIDTYGVFDGALGSLVSKPRSRRTTVTIGGTTRTVEAKPVVGSVSLSCESLPFNVLSRDGYLGAVERVGA